MYNLIGTIVSFYLGGVVATFSISSSSGTDMDGDPLDLWTRAKISVLWPVCHLVGF